MARITKASALSHETLHQVLDSLYTDIDQLHATLTEVVGQINTIKEQLFGDYNGIGEDTVVAPNSLVTTQE